MGVLMAIALLWSIALVDRSGKIRRLRRPILVSTYTIMPAELYFRSTLYSIIGIAVVYFLGIISNTVSDDVVDIFKEDDDIKKSICAQIFYYSNKNLALCQKYGVQLYYNVKYKAYPAWSGHTRCWT